MENVFASSDSILKNTGFLDRANSSKQVTLTRNTSNNLTCDDATVSYSDSSSFENNGRKIRFPVSTHKVSLSASLSDKDLNRQKSIKPIKSKVTLNLISPTKDLHTGEEKLRQNEEILLHSSFSSETDSWESIFPNISEENKFHEKDKIDERQSLVTEDAKVQFKENYRNPENMFPNFVQKSSVESTSYFIDAASLVDEDYETKIQANPIEKIQSIKSDMVLAPCQSFPCTGVDFEDMPNALSENEDSIEQADSIGADFLQKDLSLDIFQMSPIQGSQLNVFTSSKQTDNVCNDAVELDETSSIATENEASLSPTTLLLSRTPNSSMMLLKTFALKQYETEESKSVAAKVGQENHSQLKLKYNESSPIISGGASIEDHLPHIGRSVGSPLTRRKIENTPIVSGAYVREVENNKISKSLKMSCPSAWIVDMSTSPKSCKEQSKINTNESNDTRSIGRSCNSLISDSQHCSLENCNNLDSFVDSDSSEKSGREKFSKFYIDLSTISDSEAPIKNDPNSEKTKNIFCMYIDLGERSTLKEMPDRLSSSQNIRKYTTTKSKCLLKKKTVKDSFKCSTVSIPKNGECNNYSGAKEKREPLLEIDSSQQKKVLSVTKPDSKVEENKTRLTDKQNHNKTAAVILEHALKEQSAKSFVKLSDLDKPAQKVDKVIHKETVRDGTMTRSIPDYNWGDHSNSSILRSTIEVISSFHSENALSLNRLFPHLKNEFSRSMPGSLSDRTRSPLRLAVSSNAGDIDEQISDMSESSSIQSSVCVSVVENSTTEETSQTSKLIGNCQSRLGKDLLRMFLEEIAPDVIVEVSGRRIKAHKCILSSRCQYFAGILSGGWVESAGNVIVLPPFSFNTVHFALCHIYSGISSIPDSSNIVELATIADMLGLEGLKEAIMFTLRSKYCHHFHRPCQVCTAGVLECFPLSSVYGLDDLYRKCLKWITKYFYKVWPTKAFATLPKELLDKCYQQHIVNMTIDNLVSTVYGCGITVASLQNNRWADVVIRLCRRLLQAAAQYAAPRLLLALRALAPLAADAPPAAERALDDCLAAAIEWAAPAELCRAYAFLSALVREIRSHNNPKPSFTIYSNSSKISEQDSLLHVHASSWRFQCEGALVRAAPRVVGTQAFMDLPSDLRKRLRKLGCITNGTQTVPVTSSLQKWKCTSAHHVEISKGSTTSRSMDIDHVRSSFVPYAPKPWTPITSIETLKSNNDIRHRKSNRLTPPMVRTTKAQEERAKFNLTKNNQSQDRSTTQIVTTRVTSFKNTKPRYLEPRTYNNNEKKLPAGKKIVPNTSFSDSSRNSSPIQVRNTRKSCPERGQASGVKARPAATKKSLSASRPGTADPSTDSLSDSQNSNKYATYTKARHTSKGSVECIKSSQSQVTAQSAADNKLKTKIPVYLNQSRRCKNISANGVSESQNRFARSPKPSGNSSSANTQSRSRTSERNQPSEQNTSKSSSYKMIPKLVKGQHSIKSTPKTPKQTKNEANTHKVQDHPPRIGGLMERSGTFLKDESTFGNITTDIDEVLS